MRKVYVKVVPGSKIEQVQESTVGDLKVWVRAKAEDGKANLALISLISSLYKIPKTSIRIVSGQKSRKKIIEIID